MHPPMPSMAGVSGFWPQKEAKRTVSDSVNYLLLREKALHLENPETYKIFEKLITYTTTRVREYIGKQKDSPLGLALRPKAMYFSRCAELRRRCCPTSANAILRKWVSGRWVTILSLFQRNVPVALTRHAYLLSHGISKRKSLTVNGNILKKGGKFLFIMPYPYVLTKDGETRL